MKIVNCKLKILLALLPLAIFFSITAAICYSQSPTPTIDEDLPLEDIQKIRDVVKQKVQEKLKEINNGITAVNLKRGWIGTISAINNNTVTLTHQNISKTLTLSDKITIIDSKKNKTTPDKLVVGQDILAMGYTQEDGSLDTRRIVFIDLKVLATPFQSVIGKIADISTTSPIFVLIPTGQKDSQYQITTSAKTLTTDIAGNKVDSTSLKNGQKVVVIIQFDPQKPKNYQAARIIILDAPTPSPSSSPKATPSI